MKDLLVIPIGTHVRIGIDRQIDAIIMSILIKTSHVEYEVAWWDNRTRNIEYINAIELEPLVGKTKIGFISI